jgi:hypothetical protein
MVTMSRRKLARKTRRIGVALVFAALAIPAAAQAYPAGPHHGSTPPSYVPGDPGQARITQQASPAFVPADPNLARLNQQATRNHSYQEITVSRGGASVATVDSSSFSWSEALIGAGVAASLMILALGGALAARRHGRLGYR